MDIISDGMQFLAQQQHEHASTDIQYRQGAETYDIRAVYASYQGEIESETGEVYTRYVHDFIVRSEDLPIEPKQGDKIIALGKEYEVARQGFETAWRYSNSHNFQKRIHTQLISDEY